MNRALPATPDHHKITERILIIMGMIPVLFLALLWVAYCRKGRI